MQLSRVAAGWSCRVQLRCQLSLLRNWSDVIGSSSDQPDVKTPSQKTKFMRNIERNEKQQEEPCGPPVCMRKTKMMP